MKKKLILTFLFLSFIFHPVSIFAQPENISTKSAKELRRISESLNLTIDLILDNNYNKDEIIKNMDFQKKRLNLILSEINLSQNTESDNLLIMREYATILYITGAYRLAINGISLYVQDKKDRNYFLDAIVELREGDRTLSELIDALKKGYKVTIWKTIN